MEQRPESREKGRRMRCASRTPPRRHEDGESCPDSQDHLPQAIGSRSRNSRSSSKRNMPEPRACRAGEDLRALRRGEEKGKVIGAGGQVRAKRRFKVSGTMFEASFSVNVVIVPKIVR